MTQMVAKLDDLGKPVWIALMVLSFVVFWPIGLALLAFLITSGRLGSHRSGHCFANMSRPGRRWARPYYSSGNSAFDEYREQALQRLEDEQREFHEFLKQLRMAKDRTEFDRFMKKRRERAAEGPYELHGGTSDEEPQSESDEPQSESPDFEGESSELDPKDSSADAA